MRSNLHKMAIVGVLALAVLIISAGTALAAPVLMPGVTSAPGMSGTCTDCHTYAPSSTTTPTTTVSHPYMRSVKHHAGKAFKVWGYISPTLPDTTEATLTISVQKLTRRGWVAKPSLMTTGTVSQSGKFKNKTNYTDTVRFPSAGRYRMRVKLVWTDAADTVDTKWSRSYPVRVFK